MRLAINDLRPDTTYAIQVRSNDGEAVSEWSRVFYVTTMKDTVKPKTPTGVTWVVAGDSFHAEWDAVTQNIDNEDIAVTRYEVELTANGTTKTVSVTQQTEGKVTFDLSFEQNRALFSTARPSISFAVRAVDNKDLKGDLSNAITATNPPPATPTAPAVGEVATGGTGAIELAWTGVADDDIVAYNVYHGTAANFTTSASNRIFSGLATKTTFFTLNYTPFYFKIRAMDKFGQESGDLTGNAKAVSPFTVDTDAPDVPTGLTATITNNSNGIGARAALSWTMSNPPNDLAGFYVRYRKVGDTNWSSIAFQKDDRAGIVELQAAYTNYEFQIRSRDWTNNESAWSATVTATSPTNAAPANVTGFTSTPGRDAIRYDWTAVADADLKEYEITFSTSPTFASGNTTFKSGGTSLTVAGLTPSTTYYARIRAIDNAGKPSAAWSATDTETTLASSSTVSVSDLTGGEFSDIDMYLGVGADFIINGGNIRSNNYTGSTASNSDGVAGFYLGNDGLTINDGEINVRALKSGIIEGETITLSGANAKILGTGFELAGSGLKVTSGSIEAAALKIQTGANLIKPEYADFEFVKSFYDTAITTLQGSVTRDISMTGKFNSQSLGVSWASQATNPIIALGRSASDYNIPVEAGQTYIFSAYFWCAGTVPTNVTFKVKWSNLNQETILSYDLPAVMTPSGALRISGALTAPANVTGAMLLIESTTRTNGAGFNVDGVQVEKKIGALNTPSPWTPPGSTTINGGQIKTGSIQSTALAVDALGNIIPNVPAWKIDMGGNAVLGNALIRGVMIMGDGTEPPVNPDTGEENLTGVGEMRSHNYLPGQAGWSIRANGESEFLQLKANSISASAISAISPDKLNPGVISSDLVLGSSIKSVDSATLLVTHKQRTSNIATLTTSEPHGRAVGDRIRVTLDPTVSTDTSFNTPNDDFVLVVGVTEDTISYENVGPAVARTAHGGNSEVYVEGRSIVMDPTGLRLYTNDGSATVVEIPTDPQASASFAGDIRTELIFVRDRMTLQGQNNELSSNSVLSLGVGDMKVVDKPTVTQSWAYTSGMWKPTGVTPRAIYHDAASDNYYIGSASGGKIYVVSASTGALTQTITPAFATTVGAVARILGITRVGSSFYVLTNTFSRLGSDAPPFYVTRFSATTGNGFTSRQNTWEWNEEGSFYFPDNESSQWWWYGTRLRLPTLGTDGTYLLLARPNKNNRIIVFEKSATTFAPSGDEYATSGYADRDIVGVGIGNYDAGSRRLYTAIRNTTSPGVVWMFNPTNSLNVTQYGNETWNYPSTSTKPCGLTWDSIRGRFVGIVDTGTIWHFTNNAASGSQNWSVKYSMYADANGDDRTITNITGNGVITTVTTSQSHGYSIGRRVYISGTSSSILNGKHYTITSVPSATTFIVDSNYVGSTASSGTVTTKWETPLSQPQAFTMERRARLTVSGTLPSGTGLDIPSKTRFYISNSGTAGTHYRQVLEGAPSSRTFTSSPTFSGVTTTAPAFPSGEPGRIIGGPNLEIKGDGTVRTSNLIDNTPHPYMRVYSNVSQTITAGGSANKAWQVNEGVRGFDALGGGTYRATKTGMYYIGGAIAWNANSGTGMNRAYVLVRVNGASVQSVTSHIPNQLTSMPFGLVYELKAGDEVNINIGTLTTANTTSNSVTYNVWTMYMLPGAPNSF